MNNTWNKQLINCFEKGARAFLDGKPEDCPYQGTRVSLNGQRAYFWQLGFSTAKSGKSVVDERRKCREAMGV